jgi:flagellin-like protein
MKGISPLVASVLLIAVTMTIAGAVAYWASSFVGQQTKMFENQTVTSECNFADFSVYSCTYNSTTLNMTLILENIRSVELKNLTAQVIFPNGTISIIPLNDSLPTAPFNLKSFRFSSAPDYSKIKITTHCPTITKESSCK